MKQKIIGLVPAAGQATRLSPLPFSKELYPIGHMHVKGGDDWHPKPVCIYLLEKMKIAGVKDVFIILRKNKWDIPGYLSDGSLLDMNFAYLMMNLPYGIPYTLNQAFPFARDSIVVFGFPDIIFKPDDAFLKLLAKQADSGAALVLGLFPASNPEKMDMVNLNGKGRICEIQIKPLKTQLQYTWIIAVWTPVFTNFVNNHVLTDQKVREKNFSDTSPEKHQELFMSHVILHALKRNMHIDTVLFSEGKCIDIGTHEDLLNVLKITM